MHRETQRKLRFYIFLVLIVSGTISSGQVKIRLFTGQKPESALFSVINGSYELNTFDGRSFRLDKGSLVIIAKFDGKLAVRRTGSEGILCDSLLLGGMTDDDSFSLRANGKSPVRRYYSGDLFCHPDLETIMLINVCDIEPYIAGVVRSEGGQGKSKEYFKTQAVIARTYMYKYFDKHSHDRYNLCDNTHCQSFNGVASDSVILLAARETEGEVILGPDGTPIISAFHSNCGGETAPSEEVWLTGQPYLVKVFDPYCRSSHNARWSRSIPLSEWTGYLKKMGYTGSQGETSLLNFSQLSRASDYRAGTFTIPLRQIRADLNLRSTFFSVSVADDSVILNGRGYGHGVGLCQEGAMEMALKGFDYKQIISFYYTGVRIADIKNAVSSPTTNPPGPPKGGLKPIPNLN
jgi:stage II sporulation protein D